jgi:hypothetical protein
MGDRDRKGGEALAPVVTDTCNIHCNRDPGRVEGLTPPLRVYDRNVAGNVGSRRSRGLPAP